MKSCNSITLPDKGRPYVSNKHVIRINDHAEVAQSIVEHWQANVLDSTAYTKATNTTKVKCESGTIARIAILFILLSLTTATMSACSTAPKPVTYHHCLERSLTTCIDR